MMTPLQARENITGPREGNVNNSKPNVILIDQSRNEPFTARNGLRNLQRHFRNQWTFEINEDEILETTLEKCKILLIPGPNGKFYQQEIDVIRNFINSGGSVLVTLGEGGETSADTNINYLLEEFGIVFNNDSVVRTVYYRGYFDPKEALISNGVLNRGLAIAAGKNPTNIVNDGNNNQALSFVYPYGSTLTVTKETIPLLSTGSVCFPMNRPVCAARITENGGKIVALGSTHLLSDAYFDEQENAKVVSVLLRFLSEDLELNRLDIEAPDLADPHTIPDNLALSKRFKVCVQESDVQQNLPVDFSKIFEGSIKSLDLSMWAECIKTYPKLSLKHEPLTLVPPVFECPQPPLEPAVFPPCYRELPPPTLELFDLDDAFSSQEARLAQYTNRCNPKDLDSYIKEVGNLLGITDSLSPTKRGPKDIMEHVLVQMIEFKRFNYEDNDPHIFAPDDQTNIFEQPPDGDYFSDIDEYDDIIE
ncbi:unnamed protein product [Bursaphelenchus xylophilus]|uniref:(pine wood nematode) hypothetical protein n=1 Tax=Bursaphelenchus xylophilus TaxID=6326 RepID=A0A1I7SUQ0_BURXY|nr:unnamed protein product [Bursaphelenchus xylophilus]CAG9125965.1 unnamed protein product [Bursaphelenchus xylophilus]